MLPVHCMETVIDCGDSWQLSKAVSRARDWAERRLKSGKHGQGGFAPAYESAGPATYDITRVLFLQVWSAA